MKYLIGVDVGSTFTDVVCASEGKLDYVKVETTPHDLTVCFMEGIERCAGGAGDLERALSQSDPVRWSSTVATNIIAMKKGSPVGLIVTKGFKGPLAAKMNISPFIADELVAEVDEEVDPTGRIVKSVDRDELIGLVEALLDRGARVLAVSLKDSFANPANERLAKEILYQEYPEYYLGCTETFLASEITPRPDYFMRTVTTLLDAYVHGGLVKFLYKGDEELARSGSRYPMFIVQTSGGMARAAKTVGVNTIGAGPTASLSYTSLLARLYDEEPLIVFEVGGTTSNCSIGKKAGGTYRSISTIEELPLYLFSPDVTSIGLGGGTIIRIKDGGLQVGPESAGALPGPACFDLGNEEPTICDVNLLLGYIDAEYFEGGSRKLEAGLARDALRPLAASLDVTVEKLCLMVREKTAQEHVRLIKEKMEKNGVKPDSCTMVVCGGEGPVHACPAAERLGVKQVIVPQNSAVFGAVGCVLMDVVSMHETYFPMLLKDEDGTRYSGYEDFNGIVGGLKQVISQDMKAQGIKSDEIEYRLELEVEDGPASFRSIVPFSSLEINSQEDIETLCRAFGESAGAMGRKTAENGPIKADIVRVRGIKRSPAWQPVEQAPSGEGTEAARKGKRMVYWGDRPLETDIYQGEKLGCGNVIQGPAVVEEKYTTIAVPGGWKCSVDTYLNKLLERV